MKNCPCHLGYFWIFDKTKPNLRGFWTRCLKLTFKSTVRGCDVTTCPSQLSICISFIHLKNVKVTYLQSEWHVLFSYELFRVVQML